MPQTPRTRDRVKVNEGGWSLGVPLLVRSPRSPSGSELARPPVGPAPPPAVCSSSPLGASGSTHTACSPCPGSRRTRAPCSCFNNQGHSRWRCTCHGTAGEGCGTSGPRSSGTQAPGHMALSPTLYQPITGAPGKDEQPHFTEEETEVKAEQASGSRTETATYTCPSLPLASVLRSPEGRGRPCSNGAL